MNREAPIGGGGWGHHELNTLAADLRSKASAARNHDFLPNAIDQDTKMQLAIRTSEATMPGANWSNNDCHNKQSWTEMEFSYKLILGNRRLFRLASVCVRPPHEEKPLDELHERMTEFSDNSTRLENNLPGKQQKRRRMYVILCIVAILITVAVVVVVIFRTQSGQKQRNINGGGQKGTDDLIGAMRFEECLMDDRHVSTEFEDLKSLVLSHASSVAVDEDEVNMPGTSQRAALCWLSEVDGFYDPAFLEGSLVEENVLQVNQRFALGNIYYHWVPFGSPRRDGLSNSNWLSSAHVCEWDFVTCHNPNNRVTEMFVEATNLDGFIPREVTWLSHLVSLRLTNCGLTGTIPSELSNLTKLEVLDLANNLLSKTIPFEIAMLLQLRHVDLSNNMLSGRIPADIFSLPRLNFFSVKHNILTGSLPALMSNATTLTNLDLGINILQGTIPDISQLRNLRQLDLQHNMIKDSFPDISTLINLEKLVLNDVKITGTIPSILRFLPGLLSLSLARTEVTGSIPLAVGILTTLEYFDLSGSPISGRIPTELGNLSRMSYLNLERLPSLSGTFPTELGRLSKLEYLGLPHKSKISETVPSEICNLRVQPDPTQIYGPCAPQCDCCDCP